MTTQQPTASPAPQPMLIVDVTDRGLARDPASILHRNNQAFALLSNGHAFENELDLRRILGFLMERLQARGEDRIHVHANIGLLLYRLGNLEGGRTFYATALDQAEKFAGSRVCAFASIFHLREAALAKVPWVQEIHAIAKRHIGRTDDGAAAFYFRKIEDLMVHPDAAAEILGPQSASRYLPKPATRTGLDQLKFRITDSGPVLFVPSHFLRK